MEKTTPNQFSLATVKNQVIAIAQDQAETFKAETLKKGVWLNGSKRFNLFASELLVRFALHAQALEDFAREEKEARALISEQKREIKKVAKHHESVLDEARGSLMRRKNLSLTEAHASVVETFGATEEATSALARGLSELEFRLEVIKAEKNAWIAKNPNPCQQLDKVLKTRFKLDKAKTLDEKRQSLSDLFKRLYGFELSKETLFYLIPRRAVGLDGVKAVRACDSIRYVADDIALGHKLLHVAVNSNCTSKKFISFFAKKEAYKA